MRPLFHPLIGEITVEGILHALSDPVRAALFVEILEQACPRNSSGFLTVRKRKIPKSTLSQHLKVLRAAGLIRSERGGVEMFNTARCAEIEQRFPGLLPAIVRSHSIQWKGEAQAKVQPEAEIRPDGSGPR
ncbi:ArsR/SmtB family transcription factor [Paludibaculum fermentans]|uniref:ArsR/SmtB family transcription factor n=1 Tax=Paludibaculum fermentans TaxID=1473598 RepID=UPI003EBE9AA6